MVIDPDFKEALIQAATVDRFLELITAKEEGNFDPSVEGYIKPAEDQKSNQHYRCYRSKGYRSN